MMRKISHIISITLLFCIFSPFANIELVSKSTSCEQGNNGVGISCKSVSGDGRYIGFTSNANNLVDGDTDELLDIFVRDRVTGITERVNVSSSGVQANDRSGEYSLSGDGRFIVFFNSLASNLVENDTNGRDNLPNTPFGSDVFLHDRVTGTTKRESVSSGGSAIFNNSERVISERASISADRRYAAFV